MIVQLADDMPSHIVVPAIHRNRSEVRRYLPGSHRRRPRDLRRPPDDGRRPRHLSKEFPARQGRVSGNMGIAETGTVSIFGRGQRPHVPDPADTLITDGLSS